MSKNNESIFTSKFGFPEAAWNFAEVGWKKSGQNFLLKLKSRFQIQKARSNFFTKNNMSV